MEVFPPPLTHAVSKPGEVAHLNPDRSNSSSSAGNTTRGELLREDIPHWGRFEPKLTFENLDDMLMSLCLGDDTVTASSFETTLETVKHDYEDQVIEVDNKCTNMLNQLTLQWSNLNDFFTANMKKLLSKNSGIKMQSFVLYMLGEPDQHFMLLTKRLYTELNGEKTKRINRIIKEKTSNHLEHWRCLQRIKKDEKKIIFSCCTMNWIEMEKVKIQEFYGPSIQYLKEDAARNPLVQQAADYFNIYIPITPTRMAPRM